MNRTDLLLNPPITLSVVNHYVGRETMLQQSTCEGRLNAVESIVGRDKWFLISMPDLITIRTFLKMESSKIVVWTLLGKRITNTNRICL